MNQGHPRFHEILQEQAQLHDRKNTDYAQGGLQGPLGNFIRVAQIEAMYPGFDWATPFGVAMSYMLKQLDAAFILYATKRDSITGEPIGTRLNDVAVYANLARIIWEEGAKHGGEAGSLAAGSDRTGPQKETRHAGQDARPNRLQA